MCHSDDWKQVLIAVVALSLCNVLALGANTSSTINNDDYYHSTNVTHHYAIINGTKTVFATITKMTMSNDEQIDVLHSTIEPLVAPAYEHHLERSSVIFGLTKVANESNVNALCYAQLKQIQTGILRKEPWAIKVLDASGTKPSGFVFGQNFWLGSREACNTVRKPVRITLSRNFDRVMHYALITDQAPFDVDYRVVYLQHSSPWQVEIKLMSEQIIHIGLCLPSACESDEIQSLTHAYVERGLFVENDIYDMQPEVMYMKDLKLSQSFYNRRSFKLLCVLAAFTVVVTLCASLLREKAATEAVNAKESGVYPTQDPALQSIVVPLENENNALTRVKKFILCFDFNANCDKLFATKTTTAREIPVINGLRSVCAIWILLFHVMWYMYFTVNNKTFLISYAEHVFFQYVSSAPLLVDVFFAISGFLQAYNFFRNKQQREQINQNNFKQNAKLFGKALFHRCLRLVPLYFVTIMMVDLFYAYIGEVSVYHLNEQNDKFCANHWWRNLFFIQNLFPHTVMCANWTWSLACDMQYFLIANLLLFTYAKYPKLVKTLTVGILIAVILWTYRVALTAKFQLSFDSFFASGTAIYTNPLVRVLPYILGAITSWYLCEYSNGQVDISEIKQRALWNLSLLLFLGCMYSTVRRDMSYFWCTTLFVFGRFTYALTVCWMIVGSATGSGCWWSRLLEAKVFQHMNRLSYGIYLLNPFVIAAFFSLTNASTHADPFMLTVVSTGFTIIVYLASIVTSLAFEIPYCNLSSTLLRRNKLKSA